MTGDHRSTNDPLFHDTATDPSARSGGVPQFELLVAHTPDSSLLGARIAIGVDPITIGRAPLATGGLAVDDATMSRSHATISAANTASCLVEDAASKNHTLVDGVVVQRHFLVPGNVLRLGNSLFVLRPTPDGSSASLGDARAEDRAILAQVVGDSRATLTLRSVLLSTAATGLCVLLHGETGVGRRHAARIIHALACPEGPFIEWSAGSEPPAALPDRGTLFVAGVDQAAPGVQAGLAGVLKAVAADGSGVRVIASSGSDLSSPEAAMAPELLARLQEWPVHVPPLRQRPDDVLALARHFLASYGLRLSADAAEALLLHQWPFNIRELETLVRRLAAQRSGEEIPLDLLPERMQEPIQVRRKSFPSGAPRPTEQELRAALASLGGNVALVAEFFDKDRKQVYRWIEAYGIDSASYRRRPGDT